ncbi:MAG: DUF4158 domain-containing protein [Boseongicola sp. SB0677_bin_26]|nr:DUF4158 domain-containing protein [Boseongicola sp. SB0665_bin_10]MYG28189.1 DUF4158 domain-containing protein [Boseongicola sp. SB0677_bin_26]
MKKAKEARRTVQFQPCTSARHLFDLPTGEPDTLRNHALAGDDFEHIRKRRRPRNRIHFAICFCTSRCTERLLSFGDVIPEKVRRCVAPPLGLIGDDILSCDARLQTRPKRHHALRNVCGSKMFFGRVRPRAI